MAPGRTGRAIDRGPSITTENDNLAFDRLALGWPDPYRGGSRLARMSNADTYNSRPGSKAATRFFQTWRSDRPLANSGSGSAPGGDWLHGLAGLCLASRASSTPFSQRTGRPVQPVDLSMRARLACETCLGMLRCHSAASLGQASHLAARLESTTSRLFDTSTWLRVSWPTELFPSPPLAARGAARGSSRGMGTRETA